MKHTFRFSRLLQWAALCLLLATATVSAKKTDDEARAKIEKTSAAVLDRLYAANPSARGAISRSKGYATFSRWGVTLGAVGGGIGKGLAVAQPSGKKTYMRFVEGSAGLGLGIKKYDLIFVFQTSNAYSNFVNNGWEAGGQATAAAKSGGKGGAFEGAAVVSPGVYVYQVTDKGLAAEVGIKGTKYYQDKSLN
jgi:lipid-binding SYLF domain-containing protein